MNEKTAKELLKKSVIHTSDNFTNALMDQIEALPVKESPQLPLRRIAFVIGVLAVVIIALAYRSLYGWEIITTFSLNKTPILLGLTFVLLLAVNYMLRLQNTQNRLASF